MSLKRKGSTRSFKVGQVVRALVLLSLPLCFLLVAADITIRSHHANEIHDTAMQAVNYPTNDGMQQFVTEFFTKYDAEEMIPIIKCESEFKHFNDEGEVLRNRQGSSAIGVTQILASVHPDPNVIKKYNRRNNTDFRVEDFDLTTLGGNVWYALVLYETRGTKDWECAKKI